MNKIHKQRIKNRATRKIKKNPELYLSHFYDSNNVLWSNLLTINEILVALYAIIIVLNSDKLNTIFLILFILSIVFSIFACLALIYAIKLQRTHVNDMYVVSLVKKQPTKDTMTKVILKQKIISAKIDKYEQFAKMSIIIISICIVVTMIFSINRFH